MMGVIMKKTILFTLIFIISLLSFANRENTLNITSQSFYVVPKKFNSIDNAYEVHFLVAGITNAQTITISTQGNQNIAPISVNNGNFQTDVIIGYYISPTPIFNTHYCVNLTGNFTDGTSQLTSFKSNTMQILLNK